MNISAKELAKLINVNWRLIRKNGFCFTDSINDFLFIRKRSPIIDRHFTKRLKALPIHIPWV